MIHRVVNFSLALFFIILVLLYAYRESNKPELAMKNVAEQNEITTSKQTTKVNKNEIEEIVRNYINNNPELIIKSLEELHNKKLNEVTAKSEEFVKNNKNEIENSESPPFIGNKDGDIIIISFFDYNCSYCKKANIEENMLIEADPSVKIIRRPIPILGDMSQKISKIALAVNKISVEKFKQFHNEIMKIEKITDLEIKTLLSKLNIDTILVDNESKSYNIKKALDKNITLAREAGIRGTPSYIINGKAVSGLITLDNFKNIILQLRSEEKSSNH